MSLDPVLMAVIANRLDTIVREMENTLLRSGRSAVLNQARSLGDVIAALPLHAGWWFDPRRGLPRLLDRVHAAGVPIALVLEHPGDPYSVARTLAGVLELVAIYVSVVRRIRP